MNSVTVAFQLMRLELDAEVENLNTLGAGRFRSSQYEEAAELSEKGKKLQIFLAKVKALESEWMESFAENLGDDALDESGEDAVRRILPHSKSSKTALLVRFPNGDVIAEKKAADTLVNVIKRIGFERVEKLGIVVNGENLVSRQSSKKYNEAKVSNFYIKTHSSTAQKRRNIEQISEYLDLRLSVEIL
jgi:hypothetical protein